MNGLEGTELRELDFPRTGHPGSTRTDARMFISGHSLVDQPFPDNLALIARSLGTPLEWNRQYIVGSTIQTRSQGWGAHRGSWQGFRTGQNREGENLDVLAELSEPRTIAGGKYDVLLITEQSGVLGSLIWDDTVRMLRNYHEQFISANPMGSTYFYEPWLGPISKDAPQRWIHYERAASQAWQCVVTRINVSLSQEYRSDRIISMPAGLALAELIAAATAPGGVPGISQPSVRATVDLLFRDDVHMTEAGSYFVALVTYAAVFRHDPRQAAAPPTIPKHVSLALQEFAWSFALHHYQMYRPLHLEQCAQRITREFNALYWDYVLDRFYVNEMNPLMAKFRWARNRLEWGWRLSLADSRNPLFFGAATDADYWISMPCDQPASAPRS